MGVMVSTVATAARTLSLDDSLEEDHFVTPCTLATRGTQIHTRSLIDCGSTAYAFLDHTFAQKNKIDMFPLREARELTVVDGRPISSGPVTHLAIASLRLGSHQEANVPFFVTSLGKYPVVLGLPWMRRHEIQFDWSNDLLRFTSKLCTNHCMSPSASSYVQDLPELASPEYPDPRLLVTTVTAQSAAAALLSNIKKALAPKQFLNPATKLPREYHEFLDVFSHQDSNRLLPNRAYDHEIILEEGKQPPFGPLYGMSQDKLKVLKTYLEENLAKGFICSSNSPAAYPVLFTGKNNGRL